MRKSLSIILSVLVTIILGISALRYVTDYWLFSFFYSFQTHLGVVGAALSILTFLIHRSRYAMTMILISVAIVGHSVILKREFSTDPGLTQGAAKSYRLMSFNILFDNVGNGKNIADLIVNSGADVVYTLESQPLAPYLAELDKTYPFRMGCGNVTTTCDTMLISKRPLMNPLVLSLSDLRRDRFMMADIDLDGTVTHFALAHLTKPYYDDYHQQELEQLAHYIGQDKRPLILAGDFNASILQPDMGQFLRQTGLKTAMTEPKTWPIEAGRFGIAIDHVFARAPVYLGWVRNPDSNYGSNHQGLIADFVIGK